jgi:hypothetical protein
MENHQQITFNYVEKPQEKGITPLTKNNLRWRRKSREFAKIDLLATDLPVVQQTSTPMHLMTIAANFTDSSS